METEIAAIVGKVKKPPRLAEIDDTLATLRERRDRVQREFEALPVTAPPMTPAARVVAPRLRELTAERAEVDQSIKEMRQEQEEARRQYLAALRAKLTPLRARAERALAQTFADLLSHWCEIDAIAAELHRAGDRPAQHATAVQVKILFEPLVRKATGGLVSSNGAGR